MMELSFIQKCRKSSADEKILFPFEDNEEFNPHWWKRFSYLTGSYMLFEVRTGGVEVARIELDSDVATDEYVGAPELGDVALEIQFIEVASSRRGRGIGSKVVQLLEEKYCNRRLVAFSEDADGFWASQGWNRYDHQEGWPRYRPLFVSGSTRKP
ncbi:GNAT family N-acetyltransferase [Micromonospora echinofusca]|uniref:GNAT family N-acetyltransferase n=1 Tax=Micromonospora echinofusca TaxID=47858 RepID=UPI0037B90D33